MAEPALSLSKAPIVEAVVDIDCDMPPGLNLEALVDPARDAFGDRYPKFRVQFIQEHQIEQTGDAPPTFAARRGIQALQILHEDEKQLVQVRTGGFSFNRLAPYTALDDYLPEIERTWRLFVGLASPTQVRLVGLHYINRILLPLDKGQVEVSDYLKLNPLLPGGAGLAFTGFFNQETAIEKDTGNHVNIMLTTEPTREARDRSSWTFRSQARDRQNQKIGHRS